MTAVVIWRPEALNARLLAATRPAAAEWTKVAAARSPSKRVAASLHAIGTGSTFTVGSPLPLAGWLEHGVPPHTIEPKKRAMKLASGDFVSGPVNHPGQSAQPYLRPTLPLWPVLYRRNAGGAVRGF